MDPAPFLGELAAVQRFSNTATKCLLPADAGYVPRPGMFSVAGQIAHVARTKIDPPCKTLPGSIRERAAACVTHSHMPGVRPSTD